MRLPVTLAIIACAVAGCGDRAAFNGRGKKAAARADAMGLAANCSAPAVKVDPAALAKANGMASLSGELCPSVSSDVHVQMVVDFSGSMGTNDPAIGSPASSSCGRYRAIKTIADKLKANAGKEDKITLSIIGFGSSASEVLGETELDRFNPQPAAICRRDGGSTNYKAAFERSSARLTSTSRKAKVVYLISDGLPTEGGDVSPLQGFNPLDPNSYATMAAVHELAGEASANALRAANPSVTVNALLLNPATNVQQTDPTTYLAKITGDAARVRIVSQASELAERAAELLSMKVTIDAAKASARIEAGAGTSETVAVKSMNSSPVDPSKWVFTTGTFNLGKALSAANGKPASLFLEALDTSGKKHSVTVSITAP